MVVKLYYNQMIIMWMNLYWISRVLKEEAPEVVSHEEALALKDQDDTFTTIDKLIKDLSE